MNTRRMVWTAVLLAILLQGTGAVAQEARARYETMKMIVKEKFDLVLPGAMRDNDVDMWIHVLQDAHTDALALDLGVSVRMTMSDITCFVVFTDRGEAGIEKAVFGSGRGDRDLYTISGSEEDLGSYVADRDPKRIAVNMSEQLPVANGLSYTGHKKLVGILGDKYASRLISAEYVITDFRVRRVQAEIVAFAKMAEKQRRLMEEAYRSIVPGVTKREDLGWWVQDQAILRGLSTSAVPRGPTSPDGRGRSLTYERGEFLSWDWGTRYLNFGTDYKRYGYILREGELDVPEGIRHAWERNVQARDIIRATIKLGYTAGEMLNMMIKALEDAGYVYTPSDDVSSKYRDLMNALGDSDKSGFSIDCHAVGNTGNSEITVGPSMAPFRPGRFDVPIQQNNIFSLEFMVNTWNPDTNSRLSINFEDNSIVTEKGVEALYPRNDHIIIIP